jgi:hypothetical protein
MTELIFIWLAVQLPLGILIGKRLKRLAPANRNLPWEQGKSETETTRRQSKSGGWSTGSGPMISLEGDSDGTVE